MGLDLEAPWILPGSSMAMAISMGMDEFECDGCGACCGYYMIFASRQDAAREPRIADEGRELAPWLETERWTYRLNPLPFHESCCFLDADRRCTIYATRPEVCREFAAGAEPCQQARKARDLPPLLPVAKPAPDAQRS